jgi:hypothetical protein
MIESYKEQIEQLGYPALADEFRKLSDIKADLKRQSILVAAQYDTLTMQVLPDKMAEDGFKNLALSEGGRFQSSQQAYCSTIAGQKEVLFQWMRDNDYPELITEVINASTLKAFIKEQKAKGNEVPDDAIVRYDPYTRVTLVKN